MVHCDPHFVSKSKVRPLRQNHVPQRNVVDKPEWLAQSGRLFGLIFSTCALRRAFQGSAFNERMHVEWENHVDHILQNGGQLPTASVVAKAGFRSCALAQFKGKCDFCQGYAGYA